jgi:hypothetical protein
MSGWVRSGDCKPWITLRESECKVPWQEVNHTVSNTLESTNNSVVKIEQNEFSSNLKACAFKMNANPADPFTGWGSVHSF